jgi:chain length determinant protein tyrosine kinase EpsG
MPLTAAGRPEFEPTQFAGGGDRSIGDLLIEAGDLSAEQVEQVLAHQRTHGTRFGESAVQLGLVRGESVMWALSQQHQYAYLPDATHHDLSDELVVAKHPFSEVAEAVRDARSQLLAGVLDPDAKPRRALAITSPNVGDGKTWFAANLAISLSQLGARTLLIDADLRTPRLHELFGLEDARVGLSTVLSGRVRASVQRPVRELKRLYLLPAGAVPPNPLELVQGPGFGMLMRELILKFDHVVVDTPAAEHGADCRVIAARSGAALTIGRKGRSQLDALQALVQQLGKGHTQFAGVVMNEV